jgi:4-diphosphocytidyl-2-C-methyl-D-erythritol kinase
VRQHYPDVNALIERMQNFAPARMTGTGSSVFALVQDEAEGRQLLQECADLASGFVARGIQKLPELPR